jgi:F-type H+-transporting ATPase subunit epsilon
MKDTILCEIVSVEKLIFSGYVKFICATGYLGELGIYPGHSPLLSEINPGVTYLIKKNEKEESFYISGGFIEVQPQKVILLADTVVRSKDLNESAAKKAKNLAEKAMLKKSSKFEYSRASIHFAEAVAQLRVLERIRKR